MKNKSILYSFTKLLLDAVSMHLFLDIPPTHFRSFSLIVSLPLSFSFDASPTLFSYVPLSNTLYLSISPFYSPYRCHFVIVSPYLHISLSHLFSVSLTQSLTVVHFIFVTVFLSLFHSCNDMIIIIIVFVFVLIIIIFQLVLLLANMKIDILEKSLFSISHEFLYFFIFASPPCTYS